MAEVQEIQKHEVILVGNPQGYKWALLQCPCGCLKVLYVNLMKSSYPHWSINISRQGRISFSPSLWVDESECGSRFFIRKGRVRWCVSEVTPYRTE